MYKYQLSIVTPTYNRAYILPNLRQSLLDQTVKDFEWVIVDDGSTDNTQELLKQWQQQDTPFEMRCFFQANGGKHRALNNAIAQVQGQYVFIVDSDDMLTSDAVETALEWLKSIDGNEQFAGVSGLKATISKGEPVGGLPKVLKNKPYVDAKNTQRSKYGLLGDKAEIYRTDLLRKYKFMEFDNEKFLTEETVWNEIAYNGYYIRWYPKAIYLCEYLPDGLTKGGQQELKNFEGFTYTVKIRIKCYSALQGLIMKGYYYDIARQKGLTLRQAADRLGCSTFAMLSGYWLRRIKRSIFNR